MFDLLHFDGVDSWQLPYTERRRLLTELVEPGEHWQVPAHQIGDGAALLEAARDRDLEGIVAKRPDERLRAGPPVACVAQDQGAAQPGVRGRRLVARRGQS